MHVVHAHNYRIRRNIGESNIWRNSATYVSADLILANIACIHTHTFAKNIIGGLNIGDFIQKSPIAKVYSSPIFHLIRYVH